jgi:hypothetical protein
VPTQEALSSKIRGIAVLTQLKRAAVPTIQPVQPTEIHKVGLLASKDNTNEWSKCPSPYKIKSLSV